MTAGHHVIKSGERHFLRRGAILSLVLITLSLAGCGDREADQRKAFIAFLQTRIIDKPGLHVPQLTEDESKSFGPYAEQYAIITTFHKVTNEVVTPKMTAVLSKGAINSIGEMVARRDDLRIAKTALNEVAAALGTNLTQADEAHRKLNQPEELRIVFDKAYDRAVTAAAIGFKEVVPVADKFFSDALNLCDYIDQHKSQIKIAGAAFEVTDPATLKEVNEKLQTLQTDTKAIQTAYNKFRKLVYGANKIGAGRFDSARSF
jgi:hypothetical protein